MAKKRALITGITGQDGSYLADFLLGKGYEVHDLRADARKAKRVLGWSPKIAFRDLVRIMLDADLEAVGLPCPGLGKAAAIAACGRCWE